MSAFPLPDAVIDGDIGILGRKGGGKTITAKLIVERLLDLKRRVLVLDPLGVWAGLRTGSDGISVRTVSENSPPSESRICLRPHLKAAVITSAQLIASDAST